jgi:hypothetical protein
MERCPDNVDRSRVFSINTRENCSARFPVRARSPKRLGTAQHKAFRLAGLQGNKPSLRHDSKPEI